MLFSALARISLTLWLNYLLPDIQRRSLLFEASGGRVTFLGTWVPPPPAVSVSAQWDGGAQPASPVLGPGLTGEVEAPLGEHGALRRLHGLRTAKASRAQAMASEALTKPSGAVSPSEISHGWQRG